MAGPPWAKPTPQPESRPRHQANTLSWAIAPSSRVAWPSRAWRAPASIPFRLCMLKPTPASRVDADAARELLSTRGCGREFLRRHLPRGAAPTARVADSAVAVQPEVAMAAPPGVRRVAEP